MRRACTLLGPLAFVWLAHAGCATGVSEEDEFSQIGGSSAGIGGAGGHMGTTTSSGPSTSSGMGGMGGEEPAGGSGGGGTCVYDSPNACANAQTLASVAGDEDGAILMQQGTTSKWFAVQITEENGNILEEDLSYTVQLHSPAGMDFDLVVHQSGQDAPRDCGATPIAGTDIGNGNEEVHASWDDDQGIGGEDDPVWLSIEVVYVSGTACDSAAQWTLTIEGHT